MAEKFTIAIVHGHSKAFVSVKKWIKELGFKPRILKEEYTAANIFTRFRKLIWNDIHCVVVLLTGDDKLPKNKLRARQNVIFELGYSFGSFDMIDDSSSFKAENAIIVIEEDGIELFADIHGLTTIKFERGKLSKKKQAILLALQSSYDTAKTYYDLK